MILPNNIEEKISAKVPVTVYPNKETVVLNEKQAVSVNPDVVSLERENDYPIFVLHGVMGGNLYTEDNKLVWLDLTNLEILSKMDMSNKLKVKATKDQQTATGDEKESGIFNTCHFLVKKLCKNFPSRQVYFYSYDWRQGNIYNANILKNFIVQKGFAKVDLVCHSMGGIVASHFLKYNSSFVNKLVTLGTPYEGSPMLLMAMGSDIVMNMEAIGNVLNSKGMTREVRAKLTGAIELAPTKKYINTTPLYKKNVNNTFLSTLPPLDYSKICRKLFGDSMMDHVDKVQNTISNIAPQDFFAKCERHFAVGMEQSTQTSALFDFDFKEDEYTVIDLKETEKKQKKGKEDPYKYNGRDVFIKDLFFENRGDGTVPFNSATKNFSGIFTTETKSVRYFSSSHFNLLMKSEVTDWVIDVLKGIDSTKGSLTPLSAFPYMVLKVACPVDVVISSGTQSLISNTANINLSTDFGTMYFLGRDGDIKLACLDTSEYAIQLQGTDTGKMDYSLRYFDANNAVIETRDLYDVPVTKDTHIITDTNMDDPTVLVDKKRPWEKHEATITKNYRLTSKKTPTLAKKYKEFTPDDAVELYNNAEIIDDTKTIDLSEYAYLPFDVAKAWLVFAENDNVELVIKSKQNVFNEKDEEESFSKATFILHNELNGAVALNQVSYLTQSESQYIEFPVTIPENVLVIDTSQTEESWQEINLQISITQIPFSIPDVHIYTCSIYGKLESVDKDLWFVDSEYISFTITDIRNIIISDKSLMI